MVLDQSTNPIQKEWYAVYTIVRHEKKANSMLSDKGLETFLPLWEVRNHWKDRIKKVQLPLFPGYLFAHIDISSHERLNILDTQGVVRILGTSSNAVPIPSEQIEAIKILLESRLRYEPDQYFQKGRDAIVAIGPLSGVQGKIVERRGEYRLILSVDMIRRAVAVEVDIRDVELA